MISPFEFKKSGIYALAGFIIGVFLLVAVFDYQSSEVKGMAATDFFKQSPTQNLLIALVLAVPTVCGLLVGGGRARINEMRRQINRLAREREELANVETRVKTEASKLQGLLDRESGFFVDNWDQLVTEKDKLREEAEVSSALLKAALAIGNLAGPEDVLAALADALRAALFADDCLIFSWDGDAQAFISSREPDLKLKARSAPALKRLREDRVPVVLAEATAGGLIPKQLVAKLAIKSAVLIPCVKGDQVAAVAMVFYTKAAHDFSERDIQIATGIVNPATIVLENADLYQEIIANHAELQKLMTRLAESQEDERRRFSRDLHDGVIQNLSGIIFSLSFLGKALDAGDEAAKAEIEQIEKIVEETIVDLRQIINDLRPTILDSLGLVPTLEMHLERFGQKNNVQTVFKPHAKERLDGVVETALFRLAQEALNNIKKHAKAKKVTLDLKLNHKSIVMAVKDDGLGFDMESVRTRHSQDSGFGLSGMKERVQALNGDVAIVSKPGEGTLVKVTVPLEARGA